MTQLLVLADDLTGAADCAVACAAHGLRTLVALDDAGPAGANVLAADVLAIDADTRAAQPEAAAITTARLMHKHATSPELLVYKKLDSTLRGNVAAELASALEARRAMAIKDQRIVAVLAPAFPAAGRTTVNGRLLVHGTPLEETDLWQHERSSPPPSIPAMFAETHLRSSVVPLSAIRGAALSETMRTLAQDADILVCDAETDTDLRAIAGASIALGRQTLWAGSAGLAHHLPPAAGLTPAAAAPAHEPLAAGPTLFLVGSGATASKQQAQLLESWPDVISVRIAPAILRAGDQAPEWRSHQAALERALRAGVDALVTVGADEISQSAQDPHLASAIAQIVRPFADAVGALVVTGGTTARAIFHAWSINSLRVVGEVEPGLPFSVTAAWRRPLPVLTKAGGFGKPETLLNCRHFLRTLNRTGAAPPASTAGH